MANPVGSLFQELRGSGMYNVDETITAEDLQARLQHYAKELRQGNHTQGRQIIYYFDRSQQLTFTDFIRTDEHGNVQRLVTKDNNDQPAIRYIKEIEGKPLWEVIADGVYCKERPPGTWDCLIILVDNACMLSVHGLTDLPKPNWS